MNTREELLEVMARVANQNKWYWHERYDKYDAAIYNRKSDLTAQGRALEAIEAKGARVTRTGITDEMLIVFIYSLQKLHPGLVKLHYDKETLKLAINETIAASPFAPEKK